MNSALWGCVDLTQFADAWFRFESTKVPAAAGTWHRPARQPAGSTESARQQDAGVLLGQTPAGHSCVSDGADIWSPR